MPIKIDEIDRAILEQLQRDASVWTADLAAQVGLIGELLGVRVPFAV